MYAPKDMQGIILALTKPLASIVNMYSCNNRGRAKFDLGDQQASSSDYKITISLGNQLITKQLQSDVLA
jgi:hypothetical protein